MSRMVAAASGVDVRFGARHALARRRPARRGRRARRADRRQRQRQEHAAARCCTACCRTGGAARCCATRRCAQAMVFQRPFMLRRRRCTTCALAPLAGAARRWRAGAQARADAALRARRACGAWRAAQCAHAVRRRAAAPRARARLGAAARRAVSRRAHGQPRPARQARGRGADGGIRRRRHDARVRQPQPRPGEAPGQPRRLPASRAACSPTCRDRAISSTGRCDRSREAGLFVKGELA